MPGRKLQTLLCAVLLLAASAVFPAGAGEFSGSGQRPHLNGEPTRVEIGLYLIDVIAIDGASQSFTADLFMMLRWRDHRLASPNGTRRVGLDEVWNPRVQILNQRRVDTSFPEQIDIGEDGTATYRQRFFGEFSSPLDLHDFPMDRHTIGFHVVVPGYGRDEVELVGAEGEPATIIRSPLSIVDWEIRGFTSRISDLELTPGGRSIAGVAAEFEARRYLGFYASMAVLSVAIIVFMSWIVFWVDPRNIAPRMSISVTAMLTLIAYRFLLGNLLPPLSYLTRLDYFLLGSTLLVFFGIVEVAAASRLHDSNRAERALAIDRFSRWAFPTAFLVLCLASFGSL